MLPTESQKYGSFKCPCRSAPGCHSPVMLITPKCVILASFLSFRLTSNCPLDIYPPGCDPEVPQTLAKMEHTFLPRAALPPVSCLNSWYHQTWEFSLILLPPLSSHIFHQSLKTIIINSTLPPGLLTLPSSGRHSSPAPLQQLYRHLIPASSSSDPSSTWHWGRGSL